MCLCGFVVTVVVVTVVVAVAISLIFFPFCGCFFSLLWFFAPEHGLNCCSQLVWDDQSIHQCSHRIEWSITSCCICLKLRAENRGNIRYSACSPQKNIMRYERRVQGKSGQPVFATSCVWTQDAIWDRVTTTLKQSQPTWSTADEANFSWLSCSYTCTQTWGGGNSFAVDVRRMFMKNGP